MTVSSVVVGDVCETGADDDIVHLYCQCDEDLGLCGLDLSDMREVPVMEDQVVCVVCADLAEMACARCGCEWW